jgi:hypothetical protein
MTDEQLKILIGVALITYTTNTWLTIVWKTFGNGRNK